MAIVAYTGHPDSRLFTRIEFSSWDQARMATWNDGAIFGLHDTDSETTHWDKTWDAMAPHAEAGQMELFAC